MSNPQEFSELFEQLTWDEIPPAVKNRVKEANYEIKNGDRATASASLDSLQAFFESELILGRNVRLDAAIPIITDEIVTNNGIQHRPVIDPEILGQDYFYGSFSGCTVLEFNNVPYPVLAYKITQLIPNGFRTVQAPIDMVRVELQNEFAEAYDEDDTLIKGAFAALESVGDLQYAKSLARFREVFENTDLPEVLRARLLGEYGAELLSHPEHTKHLVRTEALDVLLNRVLDEELEYMVGGYSVVPTADAGDDYTPDLKGPHKARRMLVDKVGMITDFDIVTTVDGTSTIRLKEGSQPAIDFFDNETRELRTMPLKYLSSLSEYQYKQKDTGIYADTLNPNGLKPTCGEETRMFWNRVQTGEISIGDSAIRRFVLGD